MEVETLYEAPLALARCAGVATPVLDMLVALVRLRGGVQGGATASPSQG
jgi:ketopantoate reductase